MKNYRQVFLVALVLACVAFTGTANVLPRIFVLQVPEGLKQMHLPPCNYNDSAVWDTGQNVVTDSGQDGHQSVQHYDMQYAGPWYMHKALAASPLVMKDSASADLIYVNWHCYYLRFWSLLYREKKPTQAADLMKTALQAVKASDLWQAHAGANFVFYFQCPALNWLLDDCDIPSFHITHERSPKCKFNGKGPPLPARGFVIAPYSTTTGPRAMHVPSITARTTLLFFIGACTHEPDDGNIRVGKRMRAVIVKQLRMQARQMKLLSGTVKVQCSCHHCSSRLSHNKQLLEMQRSLFCLVLPGDTQSSRRITEVMLSGCIPVFIFPPLHSLPLASLVRYEKFAVFVRVADASAWLPQGSFEATYWNNDTIINTALNTTSIPQLLPLLHHLKTSPRVADMHQQLLKYRSYFNYTGMLHSHPSEQGPEDAIVNALFTYASNSAIG